MPYHIIWELSEEKPKFEGKPVPIWLCLSGNRITPGDFIENLDEPVASDAYFWLDTARNRYTEDEVQFWAYREPGDDTPAPPP